MQSGSLTDRLEAAAGQATSPAHARSVAKSAVLERVMWLGAAATATAGGIALAMNAGALAGAISSSAADARLHFPPANGAIAVAAFNWLSLIVGLVFAESQQARRELLHYSNETGPAFADDRKKLNEAWLVALVLANLSAWVLWLLSFIFSLPHP